MPLSSGRRVRLPDCGQQPSALPHAVLVSSQRRCSIRIPRRPGLPCSRRLRLVPAAVSSAERTPLAAAEGASVASAEQPTDVDVKLIGVGTRGASALRKLTSQGRQVSSNLEMWCLDVDSSALEGVAFAQTLVVSQEGAGCDADAAGRGPLSAAELQSIVGRTASDAGGRGNCGSADGSVACVLAPAAAGPGGSDLVLQLVEALRSAGHFTVAAVTRPFEFEGAAKQEQARALVAALEERAHLVAVMEQDVLMQAFGDSQLTVAEATDIADNALEHTVRCVLQAVQAVELLKSSGGALMWHGRDLRHYRRLLSPPLQQLLTCPGTGVLGRGVAALSAGAAHEMGAAKALMHLASDAVLAAGESPFLESALESASGVLCCISLPAVGQQFADASGGTTTLKAMQTAEGERHATRMAAQAAAGALRSITGRSCDDFVLCVEPRRVDPGAGGAVTNTDVVQVEATLLVLRSPNAPPSSRAAAAARVTPLQQQQRWQPPPSISQAVQQTGGAKLGRESWSMLSAMAGGAKSKPLRSPSLPARQQETREQVQPSQPAAPAPSTPHRVPVVRATSPTTPAPTAASRAAPVAFSSAAAGGTASSRQAERVTVGDYLADSVKAQSLDLPPAAAKWRQAQRADQENPRRLIVWEVDEAEPWQEEEEDPSGLAALLLGGRRRREVRVNIRERVQGVLAQDREDAWDSDQQE